MERATQLGLCTRCFYLTHDAGACDSRRPCYYCRGDHHQAICPKEPWIAASSRPSSPKCYLCRSLHYTNLCNNYVSLDERMRRVAELAVCERCLAQKHEPTRCTYRTPCCHCGLDHNHALCLDQPWLDIASYDLTDIDPSITTPIELHAVRQLTSNSPCGDNASGQHENDRVLTTRDEEALQKKREHLRNIESDLCDRERAVLELSIRLAEKEEKLELEQKRLNEENMRYRAENAALRATIQFRDWKLQRESARRVENAPPHKELKASPDMAFSRKRRRSSDSYPRPGPNQVNLPVSDNYNSFKQKLQDVLQNLHDKHLAAKYDAFFEMNLSAGTTPEELLLFVKDTQLESVGAALAADVKPF